MRAFVREPDETERFAEGNDALTLTAAYGQGISVTPIQMITAFGALANGGKLMKPTIIDEIRHADTAVSLGAAELPDPVKAAMKIAARVMTTVAYRI